jgi:hypothetical protein
VGISGLTLSGTMHARMNRLDAAINTTISTPAGPVEVKFDSAADVTQFGGSARLAVGGFVDVSGSFGIEKSGTELLVGVTDVSVFLGVNAGTPEAIGLQVSNGTLGLVLRNGKYALTSSGAVGLVGLDGLGISGTFMVEANKLGTSINRSIWTPGGSVNVVFANGNEVLKFGGSAVISVAGVFEIRGEVIATKTKSGRILIDIPEIAVALNIRGLQVFEVGGRARFSIGGPDGFQLLDVGVTEVSVFGFNVCCCKWQSAVPGTAFGRTGACSVDDDCGRHRHRIAQPPQVSGRDLTEPRECSTEREQHSGSLQRIHAHRCWRGGCGDRSC